MEMCKTLLGFAHFHRHRRHEPKQQNRTLHLLQKPDIFICYRHRKGTRSRPFGAYAVLSLMKSSTILRALSTSALGTSTFMPPGTAYGLILPRYSSWSTHWIPLPSNTDLMKSTWTMLPE